MGGNKMRPVLIIAGKEVRSYFSSPAAYIVLVLFLSLTGWFFTNTLFLDGGQAELRTNFSLIPFLLLFFVPALTMKMIADEKKSGTIELLATLPLRDTDIVLGKFLGSLAVLLTAVLLTFPNILTIGILGKPDWGVLFSGYLGLALMGAAFTSIGIYTSSVTDNQIVAFVVSFFVLFALVMIDNMLIFLPFPDIFAYIGVNGHYNNMLRGVIDTKDLVYFFSVILIFLSASAETFERRKK
jgi:ABC-2 type transport system permease protein